MISRILQDSRWYKSRSTKRSSRQSRRGVNPAIESLESRVVLYSASGNAWPGPQLITISFMPDGTNLGGPTSNLQSVFNSKAGLNQVGNDWKTIIERAAQTWAAQTNINFAVVPDNGAALGSAGNQQGDPNYGDIRIGGYDFNSTTLAQAFMPPPVNNYSIAGDIEFNTGQSFNVGTTYDLYTIAVHEIGHALGLYHSGIAAAEEYSSYNGVKNALSSDDIAGIQSIYGGVRKADTYDTSASNSTSATATNISASINATTLTALLTGLDMTTVSDVDYYKVVVPTGTNGTFQVSAVSTGRSLLAPSLILTNSAGTTLKSATVSSVTGGAAAVSYATVAAGQTYYIKVSSAVTTVFGTGAYALTIKLGATAAPTVTSPSTAKAAGSPLSSGGGQAVKLNAESLVNTTTIGVQSNSFYDGRFTAIDANGNYVVAWESNGAGVYAQRFDVNGNKAGVEFRVNTTTTNQYTPSVAMDANGDFVIVWASFGPNALAGLGVYGQRYNNQGVAQGSAFQVNTMVAGNQQYPGIAMDGVGNFTVTWTSSDQDGSGQGVYAQRYTALGVPVGLETRVNTTTAGDQMISRIGMDYLGDAVITWTSSGQDGGGLGVYAQRYAPTGSAVGGEFRVNSTTAGDQSYSTVALDAAGDFTIAWQSFGQDGGGWGIYAQRYDGKGVSQGGEFLVNTTTAGDQAFPTISMDNGGDALISWSSNSTASITSLSFPVTVTYWNIVGAQYTANGQPLGGEFQLNSTMGTQQKYSSLAMDSLGHVVVAWSGGNAQDLDGILAQRYTISFSGDSADEFFDQAESNDPKPGQATDQTAEAPPSSDAFGSGGGRHEPGKPNSGRSDPTLNGTEGLSLTSAASGKSTRTGGLSTGRRIEHRAKVGHHGVNTPKPPRHSLKDMNGSLHVNDRHSIIKNNPS